MPRDMQISAWVEDRPGALGAVAARLGRAATDVHHAYVGTARSASEVNRYLSASDVKAALRALR